MKVVKIIIGVLLILGALGNLRHIGGMPGSQLIGYLAATATFFVIGAFFLYSGLKPKPPSTSISGEEQD